MKNYILSFALSLLVAAFSGCASPEGKQSDIETAANAVSTVAAFASAAEADVENAGISENREIGIVIMADPAERMLVAQLNAGESVSVGTKLAVRRLDLTPTALVLVQHVERRTIAAKILRGNVAEGQLIVVPGKVLGARVNALPEQP